MFRHYRRNGTYFDRNYPSDQEFGRGEGTRYDKGEEVIEIKEIEDK